MPTLLGSFEVFCSFDFLSPLSTIKTLPAEKTESRDTEFALAWHRVNKGFMTNLVETPFEINQKSKDIIEITRKHQSLDIKGCDFCYNR